MEKLIEGTIYGNKLILKFVCTLGDTEFYKCRCINCGVEKTFARRVILREARCLQCHTAVARSYYPSKRIKK